MFKCLLIRTKMLACQLYAATSMEYLFLFTKLTNPKAIRILTLTF